MRLMKVRAGYLALALRLQEAAEDLSNKDVCCRLSDALQDAFPDRYAYYLDHYGDAESGDVIYGLGGDTYRAGYEISGTAGAAKCVIDTEHAEDVVPRTIYEVEADEDDHYAAMEESAKAEGTYAALPVYERFISKAERKAADGGSFAGKGKSYPILKPGDVTAAAHALGRAGSGNYDTGTIRRNIIRIAKAKGWTKYLPKAWQEGESTKESAVSGQSTSNDLLPSKVVLRECAAWSEDLQLQEAAKSDYEIKLIAPGRGATAYYTPEVLKRDGPTAFPAETKVYLNHPPRSQESEGPGNRDVTRFAAVTTRPAEYKESHPQGPGLYARMKVFADHAQTLEEKSPYLAMSIMANGEAQMESGRRVMREGVPVLARLTSGESVDVVPIAGAGGMILQESAALAANQQQESDMDETAVKKLIESAVTDAIKAVQQTQVAPLLERALRGDAREEAAKILKDVSLPEASKQRVIESVLGMIPQKDNALDKEAFAVRVNEAAKTEGAYVASLTGAGQVRGMGVSVPVQESDPAKIAAREAAEKKLRESAIDSFTRIMGSKTAAEFAAKGRYQ